MSRIEMIQPEEADADVARFYEATTAMLGRVPHSMRVLAKTPTSPRPCCPS